MVSSEQQLISFVVTATAIALSVVVGASGHGVKFPRAR